MRAMAIFGPSMFRRVMEAASKRQRFVHYTSAAAALSIIGGKSVWLRNARYLDDYTEIEHGIDHVVAFFNSPEAKPFWDLLHARSDALQKRS